MLDSAKAKFLISRYKSLKILVVGDIILDEYIIGQVHRISPEAPVPIVNISQSKLLPGGAANVANNLRSLGCRVEIAGVVGDDEYRQKFHAIFEKEGIKSDCVLTCSDRPTTLKKRVVAHNQQLLRMDYELTHSIPFNIEEQLISLLPEKIDSCDAVVLSDYDKGVLTPRLAEFIISYCAKRQIIVAVDPKPKNVNNYRNATVITPNLTEALGIIDEVHVCDEKTFQAKMRLVAERLNLGFILLTRSHDGVSIVNRKKVINIPTFAKEVYDVTGAGDSVVSILAATLAAGGDDIESSFLANVGAGIVVGKMGTSTLSGEELFEATETLLEALNAKMSFRDSVFVYSEYDNDNNS